MSWVEREELVHACVIQPCEHGAGAEERSIVFAKAKKKRKNSREQVHSEEIELTNSVENNSRSLIYWAPEMLWNLDLRGFEKNIHFYGKVSHGIFSSLNRKFM